MQEQVVKALRVRVYPTPEQAEWINATIDCCRFAYNHMLERNNKLFVTCHDLRTIKVWNLDLLRGEAN